MKIISKIVLFLFFTSSALAQEINQVVMTMPSSIIYGLEAGQKDILLSNPEDTSHIVVSVEMDNKVKRLAISSDYINLQTSEVGNTQIKLLPLINDSKIICVATTVCSKMCDSDVRFYTTNWIPINQKDLFPPKNKDWFIKKNIDKNDQDFQFAMMTADMNPMKISLNPNDTSIKIEYQIKDYLSKEDYQKLLPYLDLTPKILSWDKISFK